MTAVDGDGSRRETLGREGTSEGGASCSTGEMTPLGAWKMPGNGPGSCRTGMTARNLSQGTVLRNTGEVVLYLTAGNAGKLDGELRWNFALNF